MICSCLLAFPAFIDRYGPTLISRVRSYSNLRRSTDRGPPSEEDIQINRQSKISIDGSKEYEKLGEGKTSQNAAPGDKREPFHNVNATHRAKLGSEEAFQQPQEVETAHIV